MGISINKKLTLVLIAIAAAAAVAAAGASFAIDGEENVRSFKVSYYNNGNIVSEGSAIGNYAFLSDDPGIVGISERFIGWNTKSDLSGTTYLPGSKMLLDSDVSLHAIITGSNTFMIILPQKQEGFSISADPVMVGRGGSSIVTYSLMPSHVDYNLSI
ncbi:MAG: InlB B-repeat-containing protein, partial [Methanomassiliicoccaceae archaeon]|nr:InlB B-repeat-containing protein [Methanomassiliicoccaceae archaeon]